MKRILAASLALALIGTLPGCAAVVAGGAAAAVVATDRRSSAVQLEDSNIEMKGSSRLKEQLQSRATIDVISYNQKVLLVGYVLEESGKSEADRVMRAVPGVRQIYNELQVGNTGSGSQQYLEDSYLTTKVKTRLVEKAQSLNPNHIKVTTEAGTVFLMGLVRPAEAEIAVDVASTTSGVKKVVKLFEYID
jgi:osmotically-inducible protein OsmY